MKPTQARNVMDSYETLLDEIKKLEDAVEYSKTPAIRMELRIRKPYDEGVHNYPIEFNLELGQALYQAKLEEFQNQLEEIKKRMKGWV